MHQRINHLVHLLGYQFPFYRPIKHNNTFLSAYAHNQALLVREDQSVKRGQTIAQMGNSDADQVKLHFEIRRQGKPVDPAKYLAAN
jgi:lipoprotein NlpD